MLKYRLFVKNTFLVFLPLFWGYTLHAAEFLQKKEAGLKNAKYEGAIIELSKMGDKAKQGIEDHIVWLGNQYTPPFDIGITFLFNGQAITKKELNNPTWHELLYNAKDVIAFRLDDLKEIFSGEDLDTTTSRGNLIKALEKKIDIPSLESKTGLRATVRVSINPIMLETCPNSLDKLPQVRRRNIFKEINFADFIDQTQQNLTQQEAQKKINEGMEKATKEMEKLSKNGYIIFLKQDGNIQLLNLMVFIDLETPEHRRKRLTRLWGKRILIGSAVALPILLLLWGLFSRNKKPPQVAKKVTTTATSSKNEASPTEENNTKRRRRKRTRRANRTNP